MYQSPFGVRTDAWKPSGLTSAWIVAFGSSMPLPLKVADLRMQRLEPGRHDVRLAEQEALEAALRGRQRDDDALRLHALRAVSGRRRRLQQRLEARLVELERVELRRPHVGLGAVVNGGKLLGDRTPESLALRGRPAAPAPAEKTAPASAVPSTSAAITVTMRLPRTDFSPNTCCTFALISPSRSVCVQRGRAFRQSSPPLGARSIAGDPLWHPCQRQAANDAPRRPGSAADARRGA